MQRQHASAGTMVGRHDWRLLKRHQYPATSALGLCLTKPGFLLVLREHKTEGSDANYSRSQHLASESLQLHQGPPQRKKLGKNKKHIFINVEEAKN